MNVAITTQSGAEAARNSLPKYRTNQTDWMILVWDIGEGKFSDYWPVSTWSKSRSAGLKAARQCLEYNRGHDRVPRFTIRHLRDKDLRSLFIPIKGGAK